MASAAACSLLPGRARPRRNTGDRLRYGRVAALCVAQPHRRRRLRRHGAPSLPARRLQRAVSLHELAARGGRSQGGPRRRGLSLPANAATRAQFRFLPAANPQQQLLLLLQTPARPSPRRLPQPGRLARLPHRGTAGPMVSAAASAIPFEHAEHQRRGKRAQAATNRPSRSGAADAGTRPVPDPPPGRRTRARLRLPPHATE